MKIERKIYRIIVLVMVLLSPFTFHLSPLFAQGQTYICELGVQAGCGYYVGDAAPHIFMHPLEAYGLHFRYKFTKRWAIQAKVSGQRIMGYDYTMRGEKLDTKWQSQLVNADVMAEFNFFRFGETNVNDSRIKPYTPYIFIGLGAGVSGVGKEKMSASGYIPMGIGFKWKFSEHCGLNIAWQHNIYFADDLEGKNELNNKYHMNGWNWMNCDVTGMLTAGLVFEFVQAPKACKICNW